MGNKLIELFDELMAELPVTRVDSNLSQEHLASSLSKIGAHRKKYHTGILSGGQCEMLFQKMDDLCDSLFHTNLSDWGSVSEVVQETEALEDALRHLGRLYRGAITCKV